jgi:hypothetical protein
MSVKGGKIFVPTSPSPSKWKERAVLRERERRKGTEYAHEAARYKLPPRKIVP